VKEEIEEDMYFVGSVVGALVTAREVDVLGRTVSLPLSWADDMIGVLPVFKTKKAAKKYAGKKYEIYQIITKENIK